MIDRGSTHKGVRYRRCTERSGRTPASTASMAGMASTVQCPPACRDTLRCRPDITRSREWLRRAWAFFLGGFGAHNFYIGLRGRAIVQLCVTLGSVAIIFLGGCGDVGRSRRSERLL